VRARRLDEVRAARKRLRHLIAETKPHAVCVHSAWSQAIFGPTVLKSSVPFVRWLHAPSPGPVWLEAWASRSRAALVLCNSRYTLENARDRFADTPMVVQYPPFAPQPPSPDARSAVRAGIGTLPDAVVVVMAARLEAGKGHVQLLEALSQVRVAGWEAWIVGGVQQPEDERFLDGLRACASRLRLDGRVRFLGQRSDVGDLLSAADVYCQPNIAPDSFGLSFVEALACGLPVVTTRLGGVTEIVDDTCGALVAAGSTEAVTAALERLIVSRTEREALAAGARTRAAVFANVRPSVASLAGHLGSVMPHTLALT
jgi:glycosyltransferase involved in cell wall biosynthesis